MLKPAIKLSYYRKPGLPNFGDDMSPALIAHFTGLSINYVEHADAEIFAVGSILGYWDSRKKQLKRTMQGLILRHRPLAIWGTGLIRPKRSYLPKCEVLALRGPLTQQYAGLGKRRILLGDPAILANAFIDSNQPNDKIGIVPHYVDKHHSLIQHLKNDNRYSVIDVEQPCRIVCEAISSCSIILSSSLHGLVVADSYGIPNARLVLSNKILGGDFKFLDYAMGVERTKIPTYSPKSEDDIMQIIDVLTTSPSYANPEIIERKGDELINALKHWHIRI